MFKLANLFRTNPQVQPLAASEPPPCLDADSQEGEGVSIERDSEKCGGSGCSAFESPAMWTPGSGFVPR